MTGRDRTLEFKSVVESNKMKLREKGSLLHPNNRKSKDLTKWAEFTRNAKQIARDLTLTFSKIEKLTLMAKRRSPFDENSAIEISELSYIIKKDIASLNKQISQLQDMSRSPVYKKGMASHSSSVVTSLQSKLASMSSDFKSVLEVESENLKNERSRRSHFTDDTRISSSFPAAAMSGKSILLHDEQTQGSTTIDLSNSWNHQQIQLIDEQDTYIQSRADAMQNIESTIVELGTIFQRLAHTVKEQEEMVHRIDTNVEDANLNVQAAHMEILKYFQSVTSNRWLMFKIFAVLIVFFIIFVVFIA